MILIIIIIAMFAGIFVLTAIIFGNNTVYCNIFERGDVKKWDYILSIADEFEYDSSAVYEDFGVDVFKNKDFDACIWNDGTVSIHYNKELNAVYVTGFYRKGANKVKRFLENKIKDENRVDYDED